eukprot:10259894-Ditylum_brightwellii.AAC.1
MSMVDPHGQVKGIRWSGDRVALQRAMWKSGGGIWYFQYDLGALNKADEDWFCRSEGATSCRSEGVI